MKPDICPKCGEPLDPGSSCYDCKLREKVELEQAEKLDRIRLEAYGVPVPNDPAEHIALSY